MHLLNPKSILPPLDPITPKLIPQRQGCKFGTRKFRDRAQTKAVESSDDDIQHKQNGSHKWQRDLETIGACHDRFDE